MNFALQNRKRDDSRKDEVSNPKFEIRKRLRGSKQIQMFKKQKILNAPISDFNFGFVGFGLFRISIFGFRIFFRGRLGAINFLAVVLFSILKARI